VPLLGESLNMVTVGFALAVGTTVFVGKRYATTPARTQTVATHSPQPATKGAA
jgi:hypothetical protein